jgi:hypothetical protein
MRLPTQKEEPEFYNSRDRSFSKTHPFSASLSSTSDALILSSFWSNSLFCLSRSFPHLYHHRGLNRLSVPGPSYSALHAPIKCRNIALPCVCTSVCTVSVPFLMFSSIIISSFVFRDSLGFYEVNTSYLLNKSEFTRKVENCQGQNYGSEG